METEQVDRLLNVQEVVSVVGLSVSTIYRQCHRGTFPAPVQAGPNAIRWRASDVAKWVAGLAAHTIVNQRAASARQAMCA